MRLAKRTTRLKNNRYRVLTTQGVMEEVYADSKEEAHNMAIRAGLSVRHVAKVQSFLTVGSRIALGAALFLAPSFARAEALPCDEFKSDYRQYAQCQSNLPREGNDCNNQHITNADDWYACVNAGRDAANKAPESFALPDGQRCKRADWDGYHGVCNKPYSEPQQPAPAVIDEDAETIVPGEATDHEPEDDLFIPRGENQVLMQESDVFHPNGQLYKDHHIAASFCLRSIKEAEESYRYYFLHHGPFHGATQVFYYRLVSLIQGCQDRTSTESKE